MGMLLPRTDQSQEQIAVPETLWEVYNMQITSTRTETEEGDGK